MKTMEFEYELLYEEWIDFQVLLFEKEFLSKNEIKSGKINTLISFSIMGALSYFFIIQSMNYIITFIIAAVAIYYLFNDKRLLLNNYKKRLKRYDSKRLSESDIIGKKKSIISENEFIYEHQTMKEYISYKKIICIEETEINIILITGPISGYIFPKKIFVDKTNIDNFISFIKSKMKN